MARNYSRQVVQHRSGVRVHNLKRGTVVRQRVGSSGIASGRRAIILGVAPSSNFSRAYGKEYFVCTVDPGGRAYSGEDASVSRRNSAQFMAVGKVKHVPAVCDIALETYEQRYPQLGRKKRRK